MLTFSLACFNGNSNSSSAFLNLPWRVQECHPKICLFDMWIILSPIQLRTVVGKTLSPSSVLIQSLNSPLVREISICKDVSLPGREVLLETTLITWEIPSCITRQLLIYHTFPPIPFLQLAFPARSPNPLFFSLA